jgi:hypothetical protein
VVNQKKGRFIILFLTLACTRIERIESFRSRAGNRPPVVFVRGANFQAGYNTEVTLSAQGSYDPDNDPLRFKWSQIKGPDVSKTMRGKRSSMLTFTTLPLPKSLLKRSGFGVLPIPRWAEHVYTFRVTVSDGKTEVYKDISVKSGSVSGGWPRAPLGVNIYLHCGRAKPPYYWAIFGRILRDPKPTIQDAKKCTAYFKPKKRGLYVIRELSSGQGIFLHAGSYIGQEECGRIECHPLEYAGCQKTKMATIFKRGINGLVREDYNETCLPCHTLGYDLGAEHDGFDDIAKKLKWKFPKALKLGNWERLPKDLKDKANVQCENCHGPAWFWTGFGTEQCAQCHDKPPEYTKVAEWQNSPMSKLRKEPKGILNRPECIRCHTIQGFLDSLRARDPKAPPRKEVETKPLPITCAACHDPHNRTFPNQLRLYGIVSPTGERIDLQTGAICILCHSSRTDVRDEASPILRPYVAAGYVPPRPPPPPGPRSKKRRKKPPSRWAPHGNQMDIISGRGGIQFFLKGKQGPFATPSRHLLLPKGCVTCHMYPGPKKGKPGYLKLGGHTFALRTKDKQNLEYTKPCSPCHGKLKSLNRRALHDYDGNGKIQGIYDEVNGLLNTLKKLIEDKIKEKNYKGCHNKIGVSFGEAEQKIVILDKDSNPLQKCGPKKETITFSPEDEDLYRVAFNYLYVKKDRSKGVHNPPYIIRLLQRSIIKIGDKEFIEPNWFRR